MGSEAYASLGVTLENNTKLGARVTTVFRMRMGRAQLSERSCRLRVLSLTVNVSLFLGVRVENLFPLLAPSPNCPCRRLHGALGVRGWARQLLTMPCRVKIATAFPGSHLAVCTESPRPPCAFTQGSYLLASRCL